MNLTTSLWTTPMLHNRWDRAYDEQFKNTMLMCGLCVTYAKNSGANITMHTDNRGYEVLSKFGYDNIYNDLNILDDKIKTSPSVLWAGGKAIALENEPLGTIHIDNDVFIMKPDAISAMNFDDYDFVFQHVEEAKYKEQEIFRDIFTNINMNKDFACCVGIIGFNSEKAKRQYLDNYSYWFDNLKFKKLSNFTNADLILEQIYLFNMMEDMGYRGKSLLGDLRTDKVWELSRKSAQIGFEHIIGYSKFDDFILKKLYKRLEKLNPEIYDIVVSL